MKNYEGQTPQERIDIYQGILKTLVPSPGDIDKSTHSNECTKECKKECVTKCDKEIEAEVKYIQGELNKAMKEKRSMQGRLAKHHK